VHGGQPDVAGADTVVADGLEVIEEGTDERGVEILKVEGGRLLAESLFGEVQQQPPPLCQVSR